jgi:hypothetical protein
MSIRGSWNPGQEPPHKIAASTSRLVDGIKEFLSATPGDPIRLRPIADAVGASPTYRRSLRVPPDGRGKTAYLSQTS